MSGEEESRGVLVVKVELHSAATGQVRELGRITIEDCGGHNKRIADYSVLLENKEDPPRRGDTRRRVIASVVGHPRAASVWLLVAKALYKAGYRLLV